MKEVIVKEDKVAPYGSTLAYKPLNSFSQRFMKVKIEAKFTGFIELLKKLHINIPFIHVLSQIPFYEKFLKELISNKRKWKTMR